MLEEVDQIKLLAAQGKNQLVGALRLGAIATVGLYLLPDLVPLLHKRAPEMPLEIEENLTVNLTAMLKSGKLDVIMIALPFEEPGILVQAPVRRTLQGRCAGGSSAGEESAPRSLCHDR